MLDLLSKGSAKADDGWGKN